MKRPEHMRFWIGGFGSTGYELIYDGVNLEYRQSEFFGSDGKSICETVPVDDDAWEAFRNELDVIGVWEWKPRYEAHILDGTQWEFKIDWQYRRLNISGSNCYPESDGSASESSDYTRTFRRFLKALNTLAGERKIK